MTKQYLIEQIMEWKEKFGEDVPLPWEVKE